MSALDAGDCLLLRLPVELLVLICCSAAIKARDLVALELACSSFRATTTTAAAAATTTTTTTTTAAAAATGSTPSPTEQAARMKLVARHPHLESALYDPAAPLPPPATNFKGLLFHVDEALPVFTCPACQWRVGGFRCQGRRPPGLVRGWEVFRPEEVGGGGEEDDDDDDDGDEEEPPPVPVPTGCGRHLMWSLTEGRLVCPAGCGSLAPPACSCKIYDDDGDGDGDGDDNGSDEEKKSSADAPRYEVMTYSPAPSVLRDALAQLATTPVELPEDTPEWWSEEPVRCKTPAMTCVACGFTVADYACLGRPTNPNHPPSHPPLPLLQEGFYERVFCSYRWQCIGGCSVINGGPECIRDGDDDDDNDDYDPVVDALYRALLSCVSGPECTRNSSGKRRSDASDVVRPGKEGTDMAALEWLDTYGPATNHYGYLCVKLKDQRISK